MNIDEIWRKIVEEAKLTTEKEPMLKAYIESIVLNHSNFRESIASLLSAKLEYLYFKGDELKEVFLEILADKPVIVESVCCDLKAICERDAACNHILSPYLYFKGFHALEAYRLAHELWNQDRKQLALSIQSRTSRVFGVDIHPAAKIGKGIFIDHGTSVVIGETTVIDDNVSMLHEVTLGGTGKEIGDRHPKIRSCVLIGAGAKILGNIEVGRGAKVGAGSVVLDPVPAYSTVAGVPAVVVGKTDSETSFSDMNHCLKPVESK